MHLTIVANVTPAADTLERCRTVTERPDDPVVWFDLYHVPAPIFDPVELSDGTYDLTLNIIAGCPLRSRQSLHVEIAVLEIRNARQRAVNPGTHQFLLFSRPSVAGDVSSIVNKAARSSVLSINRCS